MALVGREQFLSNSSNKSRLIDASREKFAEYGISTLQAKEDADVLIVKTAVKKGAERRPGAGHVFIVGEDVDLLVLLLYHSSGEAVKLFKPSRNMKTRSKLYCPHEIKKANPNLEHYILFLHAFSGLSIAFEPNFHVTYLMHNNIYR